MDLGIENACQSVRAYRKKQLFNSGNAQSKVFNNIEPQRIFRKFREQYHLNSKSKKR